MNKPKIVEFEPKALGVSPLLSMLYQLCEDNIYVLAGTAFSVLVKIKDFYE